MLEDLQQLAVRYADMQRDVILHMDDPVLLRKHIRATLGRCLPPSVISDEMTDRCFSAIQTLSCGDDPLFTGAIHAWAGLYLLTVTDAEQPLLRQLHRSALKLLPEKREATRDDLRLVTLDALYDPRLLPRGEAAAFARFRLGLNGPRLSCEEIALRMHKPLVYIHELESAVLTILSAKGDCHA